jgi:hypothetical protein
MRKWMDQWGWTTAGNAAECTHRTHSSHFRQI